MLANKGENPTGGMRALGTAKKRHVKKVPPGRHSKPMLGSIAISIHLHYSQGASPFYPSQEHQPPSAHHACVHPPHQGFKKTRIMNLKIFSALLLLAFSLPANPAFAQRCGKLCDPHFMKRASPAQITALIKAGANVNARAGKGITPPA